MSARPSLQRRRAGGGARRAAGRRAGLRAEDAVAAFFEQRLLADGLTSEPIKTLLRSGGGFVDRGVVFRDLTGDKRDDAVVRVHSGGAAGVVAVYVFSTANRKGGKLQAMFRSQNLMRASTRVLKGVLSYRTSRYEPGDELCCPARHHAVDAGLERRRTPACGCASASPSRRRREAQAPPRGALIRARAG